MPSLFFAKFNCSFTIFVNSFSPESSNNLFAGIVLDNSKLSKLFRVLGKSEANSGPFLTFIEYLFSKSLESHWTKPGNKTKSYFEISIFSKISDTISSVRNADIDIGAFIISIE